MSQEHSHVYVLMSYELDASIFNCVLKLCVFIEWMHVYLKPFEDIYALAEASELSQSGFSW